ncbi:hypothetical protein RUM44_011992 [Polyplax serrata]|uniref:Uncharacterized protein n=1 Tax=Polyplax serrata TaxID=468196 RepID=A0ABR1BA24_POLSC
MFKAQLLKQQCEVVYWRGKSAIGYKRGTKANSIGHHDTQDNVHYNKKALRNITVHRNKRTAAAGIISRINEKQTFATILRKARVRLTWTNWAFLTPRLMENQGWSFLSLNHETKRTPTRRRRK